MNVHSKELNVHVIVGEKFRYLSQCILSCNQHMSEWHAALYVNVKLWRHGTSNAACEVESHT